MAHDSQPGSGRVRAGRDENGHVPAGWDQVTLADEALDVASEIGRLHGRIVLQKRCDVAAALLQRPRCL